MNIEELFKPYCLDYKNADETFKEKAKFALEKKDESFELFKEMYDTSYGTINIDDNLIDIHTGGWSENEYLISVFQKTQWWIQHLQITLRGGHYYFDTASIQEKKKEWDIIKK